MHTIPMVAWLSLVIATLALGWTIYRDVRQREALRTERRERVAADEKHEKELRAARLVADVEVTELVPDYVEHRVRVRNIGAGPATDAFVWLVERLPDGRFSGSVSHQHRVGTITPGDAPHEWNVSRPWKADAQRRAGSVLAMWVDGNGQQPEQEIGRTVVFV